jgi:hypothetical protein
MTPIFLQMDNWNISNVLQDFSHFHSIQTSFGVHPASYPTGTGGSFPGGDQPGREADHSHPTSAEIKKKWL